MINRTIRIILLSCQNKKISLTGSRYSNFHNLPKFNSKSNNILIKNDKIQIKNAPKLELLGSSKLLESSDNNSTSYSQHQKKGGMSFWLVVVIVIVAILAFFCCCAMGA